jgi:hypothetical protein
MKKHCDNADERLQHTNNATSASQLCKQRSVFSSSEKDFHLSRLHNLQAEILITGCFRYNLLRTSRVVAKDVLETSDHEAQ